nr:bifunctional phosphoribosylaminoimidazolecarboxamide formyltransferase/IMP cyclohydrolase [Schaalia sp. lx-260]
MEDIVSVRLDHLESIDFRPITRVLISVYDKTGLESLAAHLHEAGVEIVSTGSTAARIADAGISVTPVDNVTGFPEILEGRVKTLHPKIHAGILADQRKADHRKQIDELHIAPFDAVVCNLYPFSDTVSSGALPDECVEQIDIGGPSMVRAAAKNYPSVAVVTSPAQYDALVRAAQSNGFTLLQRRAMAAAAFKHTALYDTAVAQWFSEQVNENGDTAEFPRQLSDTFTLIQTLRYGENPHQKAAVYSARSAEEAAQKNSENTAEQAEPYEGIAHAVQLNGKPMSYNNYTDGDAALRAAYDHEEPCVAIIKHANPCGIAIADTIAAAHRQAHACDPVSAFGGVIAANRMIDAETARQIVPIFTEVVIAPAYEAQALEILKTKKNLRVLAVKPPVRGGYEFKQISGGLLVQRQDDVTEAGDDPAHWECVAGQPADSQTLRDLVFAWRCVRSVRSNAILLAKDGASVGVGMGQVNRVDSCKLAVERANTLSSRSTGDAAAHGTDQVASAGGARADDLLDHSPLKRSEGAVAASDAFFPFADGLQTLIDAGVKAVVQPGGSVRDQESIDAATQAGITMYFTGTRHFAH